MYEVMRYWEQDLSGPEQPAPVRDFAGIWQAAEKVVYSRTLDQPSTARTRIEREFEPAAVRQMKAESARPISVGGPELAGQAIAAGLVDELNLLIVPIIIGAGNLSLPRGPRVELELLDEHRFRSGAVNLRYRVRT